MQSSCECVERRTIALFLSNAITVVFVVLLREQFVDDPGAGDFGVCEALCAAAVRVA